jgi:branched-chain amino acid transport system ATP-binding protein
MILDLNQQGLTVVIIEHRLRELMKLVQKVMVIHFGEKIAEGSPETIIRDPRVIQAYLGERSPDFGLA